ncbi:hypothetical protein F5X97DRAFT_343983 [Nemania serpens]|nr:hypothetical protein F5X97DRAFT_343983 [Nemania serpens]
MATDDADEEFHRLLADFERNYESRLAHAEKNMGKILELLPNALKMAGIKYHEPIAHRAKELESAKGALKRRLESRMERLDLKTRLEKNLPMEHAWERYWKERNSLDRIEDVGPFQDYEAMFDCLHDLAGLRILLYFPGEVEKVVQLLRDHPDINVRRVIERGTRISPDTLELKQYVNNLEKMPEPEAFKDDKIFSGYRATHIIVSPNEKSGPVVEIQVATVVMNAWAQVEHDMIYKPSGPSRSKEVMQILDTFNGVVMIGENALRQLENTINRQKKEQENEAKTFAWDIYDLGRWIKSYCAKNNHPLLESGTQSLSYLDHLFDVLRIREEHTLSAVNDLIAKHLASLPREATLDRRLPLHLILQRYKDTQLRIPKFTKQEERRKARFLAMRVVESLNIAAYLGILDQFVSAMEESLPDDTPSLVDFLDILHPQKPIVHGSRDERITNFCESFLDRDVLRKGLGNEEGQPSYNVALMEVPIMLSRSGIVAMPTNPEQPHADTGPQNEKVRVPRALCALLNDPEHCHWMPELCSAAKAVGHESGISLDMFSHLEGDDKAPLLMTRTTTKGETQGSPQTNVKITKKIGNKLFILETGDKKPIVGQKPDTWWELNVRNETGRPVHEYHADKTPQAERPRQPRSHPGFFESRPTGENQRRMKWFYEQHLPRSWELRVPDTLGDGPDILRREPRRSELLDIGNSLTGVDSLECRETREEDLILYILVVDGVEFHLKSQRSEFVLHQSSYHENIAPAVHEAGASAATDSSVQAEEDEDNRQDIGSDATNYSANGVHHDDPDDTNDTVTEKGQENNINHRGEAYRQG